MPFSQTYPMCCINIRNFVDQFYQFTDGVVQQHLDIDEVLRKVSPTPYRCGQADVDSLWMVSCRITFARKSSSACGACLTCRKSPKSW